MAEEMNYIGLLQRWQDIIAAHEESLKCFLEQSSPICREYERSKQQDQDDSFNVFYLISDLYYRENFHSDIIAFLLDTTEKHGDGDKFLSAFISFLQDIGCERINQEDYKDATAVREEDRIDILIKSESSKRAIIIENKINDAGDMPRQLPRYYDYVTDELNYQVDAIVYLPLKHGKSPDQSDWTKVDEEHVLPLLKIIPAYDKSHYNIVDNWLYQLETLVSNVDVLSMIHQYSRLIKLLNSNVMDSVILEKFYNKIKEGNNLETVKSIRDMITDLPYYLARQIFDRYHYRCAPFSKVSIYSTGDPRAVIFEGIFFNDQYYKIDVVCNGLDGFHVTFWAPEDRDPEIRVFNLVTEKVVSLRDFCPVVNAPTHVFKHFEFMDELGLYNFLDSFLKELAGL